MVVILLSDCIFDIPDTAVRFTTQPTEKEIVRAIGLILNDRKAFDSFVFEYNSKRVIVTSKAANARNFNSLKGLL